MTFLTPGAALLAAALAVPILLLLYFLKLRRRAMRVSSSLLWQQSFRDLQVNTPFQRLRYSPLLVLQALVIAALLLALAQPVARMPAEPASRVVLIVDHSASMSATDGPEGATRLERARTTARELIEQTERGAVARRVMLISCGRGAAVVSGFESRPAVLLEALDTIEPTDETADLQRALHLADAFAGSSADESTTAERVEVILLSDGGLDLPTGPRGFRVRADGFRFLACGPPAGAPVSNLGIVTFSARRDFEEPGTVVVFARAVNAGSEDRAAVLTLYRNEAVAGIRRLDIPATDDSGPGEASTTFTLDEPGGAVLRLTHDQRDDLPADDTAWIVLPPPAAPRIALVHGGTEPDPFVLEALTSLDPGRLDVMSADRFEAQLSTEGAATARYDLIIFERVSGHRLPSVPTLTLGGAPGGVEVVAPSTEGGRRLITWDRQAPVLRHVALDEIVYTGFGAYDLPTTARGLASGPDGPVIAAVRSRGAEHLLVGFEMTASSWPVQVSFTVFIQNVVQRLPSGSGDQGLVFAPGQSAAVRPRPAVDAVVVRGPAGAESPRETTIPTRGGGAASGITMPSRAGLYEIDGARPPHRLVAVSVLSDVESDLRGRDRITVNAAPIVAGAADAAAPRHLWPWLVAAAGLLLLLEWTVYLMQVRAT